jgi:hypothetical protein
VKALERVPPADKAQAGAFLGDLLTRIEQDRAAHGIRREEEAADLAMVEKFALTMFAMADRADRAGMANKDTVRNYMAAGPFFDAVRALSQGGAGAAPNPKLEELSKYAKVRSMSILKDLKAGKTPAPPEGQGACPSRRVGKSRQGRRTPHSPLTRPIPTSSLPASRSDGL